MFLTSHRVSWLHFPLLTFFQFFWVAFPLASKHCSTIGFTLLYFLSLPSSIPLLPAWTHTMLSEWFIQNQSVTMPHSLIRFSFSRSPLTQCQQRERGHQPDTSRWRWKLSLSTRYPVTPLWQGRGGAHCSPSLVSSGGMGDLIPAATCWKFQQEWDF